MVRPGTLLLASALLVPGWRHARADVKMVVTETTRAQLPEPLDQLDLLGEVAKELSARGCGVVDSCRTADCQAKAIAAGATDVLRVMAEYSREQYSCSVAVELRPAGEGAVKFNSRFASATCPAMDSVDHAKELGARACEQLLERPAPPVVVTRAEPPAAGRAVSPRSVALLGGGALVAGLGAALWYLDGRCAHAAMLSGETGCRDLYDTKALGIPLTALGVVSMAAGGWLLWHDGRTAVSVGPATLTVAGRF